MDETRLRAVIREEIRLAVWTLGGLAESRPDSDFDGLASEFHWFSHYQDACESADEKRARDAENPFEGQAPSEAVDPAVKALVRAEVLDVLKEMRSAFYSSGYRDDYQIAERLNGVITARERAADE